MQRTFSVVRTSIPNTHFSKSPVMWNNNINVSFLRTHVINEGVFLCVDNLGMFCV